MTSDQEVSRYRATSKLASDVGGTHDYNYEGKVLVRRCRISRDGYDDRGRYWGVGAPLYHVMDSETEGNRVDFYIRAYDVAGVRSKIRAAYPGAAPGTRKRKTAARR